jgi:hypothetical protein
MAVKSGSDFDDAYNGSTGSDGNQRTSDGYTKCGDTYVKHDGRDTYLSKKDGGVNGRSDDHAHYYNDSKTGKREVAVSRQKTADNGKKYKSKVNKGKESDLFSGFKYFLGIDD